MNCPKCGSLIGRELNGPCLCCQAYDAEMNWRAEERLLIETFATV